MYCIPIRVLFRIMLSAFVLQPLSSPASIPYDRITHRDQVISINYHASLDTAERKLAHQWLTEVTGALLSVYGELPKDRFNITIRRSSSRSSPVPWGQVERGTPTNVLLVINPDLGYEELINDWTAFHELSHLLLPYRGHGNIWLSEGLATYYQNIIQARAGLFDDTEMWRRIAAGFERGSKDQRWRHINLTAVSDNLGETRQYMRVHWSGVLFWLTADSHLRKHGNGTLDDALQQLRLCCENDSMSAEAIVRKLDKLTNENIFVELFNEYCESYTIPEYKTILAELGINIEEQAGGISLVDDAPSATIRQQIHQR